MRILVLGASGMLGNAMMKVLSKNKDWQVFGTIRSQKSSQFFTSDIAKNLLSGVDVEKNDSLLQNFISVRPDVVINCIGLVKQLDESEDPLSAIPINSILPHQLARLCKEAGARLVHISTDCVFSGEKGMYKETDCSDAKDFYGKSKYLGEVDYPHAITLRTSIIGHELNGARSLVGWFLAQEGSIKGFKRAIFSGLPTFEIAHIIRDYVIPQPELHGLYHVSAEPISKYDLLSLVAQIYGKTIKIIPEEEFVIDRSLDSSRFRSATGYEAPDWQTLIELMHGWSPSNTH